VADWAATTTLPRWLGVPAAALTSQHFWDQMAAVPVAVAPKLEKRVVARVLQTERVSRLRYDQFLYALGDDQCAQHPGAARPQ
jgi:hypothetical protein